MAVSTRVIERLRVWPGEPTPRGATWDGRGVNFALFSQHAERVEVCFFDPSGRREVGRVTLPEHTDEVWHGYLPDIRPGQLYGYRVHGPYDPSRGHRFNPHKLLLDPYAKLITGQLLWSDAHFGYRIGHRDEDLSFDRRNTARGMPTCVVVDTAHPWTREQPPRVRWHESIVYELHVRGFTMRHPEVPKALRGTFEGLSTPSVIAHLRSLGITAVELLPVQAFLDDRHLIERELSNYWGYNTLGFFAPDPRFLASGALGEFKTLVQHLHDANIEVILDVVYNHTAEGNHMGPTLSFRGIDNASYYRLVPGDERYYMDFTGCGNALNLHSPRVLQLVMDSLRYWVEDMHVDGFRFDLAATLARDPFDFDPSASFLDTIGQDPVLSRVKLIAEPWDVGDGGYRLGGFPPGWAEWNDRYRDTARRFWKGDAGQTADLASRVSASADIFDRLGRRPWASVNFVTAHDGFTLRDLVSYDHKHNEANGEENRDGTDDNHSWNCGAEGPSDDPEVVALRLRQSKNLLGTLLFSQGLPMLVAGDELGRTQGGNNNAYCQDNEISWVDWSLLGEEGELLDFVRRMVRIRRDHIAFHRHRFFRGQRSPAGIKDITWLRADGHEREGGDWDDPEDRTLGAVLCGDAMGYHLTAGGEPEGDASFLILLNAYHGPVEFRMPGQPFPPAWRRVISSDPESLEGEVIEAEKSVALGGRTLELFVEAGSPTP